MEAGGTARGLGSRCSEWGAAEPREGLGDREAAARLCRLVKLEQTGGFGFDVGREEWNQTSRTD